VKNNSILLKIVLYKACLLNWEEKNPKKNKMSVIVNLIFTDVQAAPSKDVSSFQFLAFWESLVHKQN